MNHGTYYNQFTCTNDAGSSYGDSGFIDVKTHGVNENFQLLP